MFLKIVFTVLNIVLFVFLSKAQVLEFNKTYGEMTYNYGQRIIQASDKGYFILGNESGDIGNTNIHIIRTDSLGTILFEKIIGDASLYWANDFKRTSDKGLLITGFTNSNPDKGYDVLLIKTDSNANVEWQKTYGGDNWDMANAVVETKDSAYLVVGETYSYGPANENIYIIKTNFNGDTIWTRTFGGDSTDYAMAADVLFDSSYLIGATTNSFGHGNFDGYVLNLTKNGDTIWTQTFGEDKEDILNSIKQTPDSGFVFVGSTTSYNAIQHENWLMRFDKSKNFVWKIPEFWQILSGDDVFTDVIITDSAQYAISGYSTSIGNGGYDAVFYLMGEFPIFKCSHSDGSSGDEKAFQVIQTEDKAFAIIGNTNNMGISLSNIYLIKMGLDCSYSNTTQSIVGLNHQFSTSFIKSVSVSPTLSGGIFLISFPESLITNYKIVISDIQGRIILTDNIQNQQYQTYKVDLSSVTNGMYFITVIDEQSFNTIKVVKVGNLP